MSQLSPSTFDDVGSDGDNDDDSGSGRLELKVGLAAVIRMMTTIEVVVMMSSKMTMIILPLMQQ